MRDIRVAAAQFESRANDRAYNLGRIRELTARAVGQGAEIVSFHEVCIPGYSWMQPLGSDELCALAEPVPDGPSTQELIEIARTHGAIVMAGLLERGPGDAVYNSYIAVSGEGLLARHHKLHPFINPHLTPGEGYTVFEARGCTLGILTCYDNNLVENARMTALLGAEIVFAPHVTGCLPSAMPGRGTVSRELWDNRHRDPVRLRQEFAGPKGRGWLLRWLPTRAYENGVYYVFSNPIGWDYDGVRPGLAMVIDPFGEILRESHELDDDVVVALCTADKREASSGQRYLKARRPELYGKLVEPQASVTLPGWAMERKSDDGTVRREGGTTE